MNVIKKHIQDHLQIAEQLYQIEDDIAEFGEHLITTFEKGNKVLVMGNGGSAADCQHFAAELVGRFEQPLRKALPCIALTTDSSVITSLSNDFDYSQVFARQIKAHAKKGDLVLGISTSGNSKNIIEGMNQANKLNCYTIGLLGKDGGKIKAKTDFALVVSNNSTARIQECHILILHIMCDIVDQYFTNK